MLYIIIIVIFVLYSFYTWITMLKNVKVYKLKGPYPVPISGNAHIFIVKPNRFLPVLHNLNVEHGDVVLVHLITDRYVILYHPKYIEEVMTNLSLINKGKSYSFLVPWLGQGLLTAGGTRWKTHRKFLTPAFHFNILQNFLPVFLKNDKILVDKLKRLANGADVDLFPLMGLCALDNVTESIMGVCFNAQSDSESKYVKTINEVSTLVASRMRNPFLGPDIFYKLSLKKRNQDNALKFLHDNTISVIDTRRKTLENVKDGPHTDTQTGIKNKHAFLDLLLLAEVDGKKLDDEIIREEVDTFMFEGYDTTTSGLVFALYCISQNKGVQEKILQEQKDILGEDLFRDPSYTELKQMKYLESVIKESLRLYPSVPLITRMTKEDTDIAGMHLLKDTNILINIFHMQRNPDVYDNPLQFRPERFETQVPQNAFNWLAFSAGPRNCIGQKFAMMELKVTISAVCKHFTLQPSDIEPVLCADLILRSDNGVHVRFKPRQH